MGGVIPAPNIAEWGLQESQIAPNAAAEYARVAQLQQQTAASRQQMQQQAAMAPLQQQSAEISVQQQQREMQDEQAVRDAYKNSGGDLTKFQQNVTAAGVGPKAALGAVTMVNNMRQSVNALGESDLKLTQAKHEQLAPMLDTILQAPPESQAAIWTAQINDAQKRGLITPQEAQQHAQYPGPDGVKMYANSLKTADQLLKERQADNDAQKANAGDWKEGGGGTLVNVNPKSPYFGKIAHGAGNVDQAEMQDWLAKNSGKGPSDFMAYKAKLVPQFNFNLNAGGAPPTGATAAAANGVTDPKALQNAVPPNIRPTVLAITEGRMSPPGSFALKQPYWQNVMNNVFALDPQWNEQRAQLRKDYTVGAQSKEINAINTAMGHVGVMGDAVDALNNGNVQILNRIANNLGAQIGQTPQTTFNTIVHRVGPEITKAYVGAGGGEGERGTTQKDFDPALGPDQLKTNIGITAQLLRSKISSLQNQWDQNTGPGVPQFQDRFIMPEAKRQLDKWAPQGATGAQGGGGAAIGVRAPNGKIYNFPTQQAADNFKKAAGIQ